MIYSTLTSELTPTFEKLLSDSVRDIKQWMYDVDRIPSPTEFEDIIEKKLKNHAIGTDFDGTIERTGKHAFPDIIGKKYFGIEVKMTKDDKWTSIGNSIFEGQRTKDVEKIYMVFGKFGGKRDVQYRPYSDCLSHIAITHSPRYLIDMELLAGESIFDMIGHSYDTFRSDEKQIEYLRKYYMNRAKPGEKLWWMNEKKGENITQPVISRHKHLSLDQKKQFMWQSMILCPEIFSNTPNKFDAPAALLLKEYNALCGNIRDIFSAGGKEKVEIDGKEYLLSKIFFHLMQQKGGIRSIIDSMQAELIIEYWGQEPEDRYTYWKMLIHREASSDMYEFISKIL